MYLTAQKDPAQSSMLSGLPSRSLLCPIRACWTTIRLNWQKSWRHKAMSSMDVWSENTHSRLEKQNLTLDSDLAAAIHQCETLRGNQSAWPPSNEKADPSGKGLLGVMDDELGFVDWCIDPKFDKVCPVISHIVSRLRIEGESSAPILGFVRIACISHGEALASKRSTRGETIIHLLDAHPGSCVVSYRT